MGALGDRPVTLQRFPEGIEGEEFYSKNPPRGVPEWARTVMCTYPSGRRHSQLVVDEAATAVWAIQMNTVTFHPWPVRTEQVDNPDELRIDLDPQPGRTFADAVEAAFALREVLAEIGLTGWAKTSGNRGVHVYCRVRPTHEFLDVRHGVIGIARELERRLPDLVTTAWWKEERGERVFVDFNQACRDRTIASAYSPRPLPGAPVSMPVGWDRLAEVTPADFTVLTVPGIVAAEGDPWAGIDDAVGDVASAIALWDKDVKERGLGEMPFPPDYPKMPGEPPRVQPSKRRQDRQDSDYLGPKADRDAEWGLPVVPPGRPDAREVGQGRARGGDALRAQVGRVPLDRLPLRRPRRDRQPQREADDPLLPGGGRGGQGQPAGEVRRRRRDRRHRAQRRPARLRPAAAAHPPRRQPGEEARPGDPRALRRVRPARARGRRPQGAAPRRAQGPAREGPRRCGAARAPDPRHPRPGAWPSSGSSSSRAPGSTASSPSRSTAPTSPTSG